MLHLCDCRSSHATFHTHEGNVLTVHTNKQLAILTSFNEQLNTPVILRSSFQTFNFSNPTFEILTSTPASFEPPHCKYLQSATAIKKVHRVTYHSLPMTLWKLLFPMPLRTYFWTILQLVSHHIHCVCFEIAHHDMDSAIHIKRNTSPLLLS